MKVENFEFTIETAFGNKLETPIVVKTSFNAFESIEEIRQKNEFPSDKEIVGFKNAKEKASVRAAETTKALEAAGIQKPTLENSPKLRYQTIVDALMAGGETKEVAEQKAAAMTGYNG